MLIRYALRCFALLALLLVGLAASPLHAQELDSAAVRAAFDSTVAAHTYTATLDGDTLTGPGADWLVERGREADHFLMGERHGTAEIPKVAASLYERLAEHGYGPVALEIGPFAAQATDEALEEGGYSALESLITRYEGPAIPFLNRREESEMAARMAEAGATIWGVDYEFIFSLPMHLDALAEQAETNQEQEAVETAQQQMREEWGGAGGRAVAAADPAALQSLRAAFEPRGDETALARIDELLESNTIYAPYVRDEGTFFESSNRRESLMKERLIDSIRAWEAEHEEAPKVFHKNAHVAKHHSDHRFITLGGFMAEWARSRSEETFHVVADCNGGEIPQTGQGGGGSCTAWIGGEDSPFADHLRDDTVTVIDLQALRAEYFDSDVLPDELRYTLVAYDAYVAIPDVQHSEPLNPVPRGE